MIIKRGEKSLCIRSGLLSAIGWGIVGTVAPLLVVLTLQTVERWQDLTMLGEYRAWFHSVVDKSLWPALGCGTVLSCSAWAARAVQPVRSLAVSSLLVTSASVMSWWVLAAAEITPRRLKGIEHPAIYFSEFLVIVIPPIVVAGYLTWASCHSGDTDSR